MPELSKLPANPVAPTFVLKVPQVRVLVALLPDEGDDPPLGTVPRFELAIAAGITPTTGTINRALNGIPKGSSSGDAHDGLLAMGLVEKVVLDLDGRMEDSYRITRAGIAAAREWLKHNRLPPTRDAASCTNARYAVVDTETH